MSNFSKKLIRFYVKNIYFPLGKLISKLLLKFHYRKTEDLSHIFKNYRQFLEDNFSIEDLNWTLDILNYITHKNFKWYPDAFDIPFSPEVLFYRQKGDCEDFAWFWKTILDNDIAFRSISKKWEKFKKGRFIVLKRDLMGHMIYVMENDKYWLVASNLDLRIVSKKDFSSLLEYWNEKHSWKAKDLIEI